MQNIKNTSPCLPIKIVLVMAVTALAAAGNAAASEDVAELAAKMDQLSKANTELGRQMAEMQEKISRMESQGSSAAKNGQAVTAGDEKGSIKLPGSATSVSGYGFVRLDAYKDIQGTTGDWIFDPGTIAIAGDPSKLNTDTRSGKVNLKAQYTRLGLKTLTPTDMGSLRTRLEVDFRESGNSKMGYSNGYNPRLRAAYGELDGEWGVLLVGQTYSTFMNTDPLPETINVGGHGSSQYVRQGMFRYTYKMGAAGNLSLAFENPATMLNGVTKPQTANNIDTRPDVILQWGVSGHLGSVSAQALSTRYSYNNLTTAIDKNAYGYSVGGVLKLGDWDSLLGSCTAGDGIARYLPSANYNYELYDAASKRILLSTAHAYTLGWARAWSPSVRTNLSYGSTLMDVSRDYALAYGASVNRKISQGYANVFWAFTQNAELGLEYLRANRQLNTGESGDYSRVQTLMKFNF